MTSSIRPFPVTTKLSFVGPMRSVVGCGPRIGGAENLNVYFDRNVPKLQLV